MKQTFVTESELHSVLPTATTFEVLSTSWIASSASSTTGFWAAPNPNRRLPDRHRNAKTSDANKTTLSTLSMTKTTTMKVTSKLKFVDSRRRKVDEPKKYRQQLQRRCRIAEPRWTKRSTTSSVSWRRRFTSRRTTPTDVCRQGLQEDRRRQWHQKMTRQGN